MSYNSNYYQQFSGEPGYHMAQFRSPPPWHPRPRHLSDEDFVKQFENKITNIKSNKPNTISISKIHSELRDLAVALNNLKLKQKLLSEQMDKLSDEQWTTHFNEIEENKDNISKILLRFNDLNTDILRKVMAKRSSKRERLKRQKAEKRRMKEELKKQNEEKSRKIDEYLQGFQNDIIKARQEEEAKLQADAVLKETTRKKEFAKKYIKKIGALTRLRRARMNTARGRGEPVSQKEAEVMENNLDKLKSLWCQRLIIYEKEETELRAKLQQDSGLGGGSISEREVRDSLDGWTRALFGGTMPQVDLQGDVEKFVAIRSRWDKYVKADGVPLPIGWVPPPTKT